MNVSSSLLLLSFPNRYMHLPDDDRRGSLAVGAAAVSIIVSI